MLTDTTTGPRAPRTRRGAVAGLADWSARHRALAIGGWLALVALAVLCGALPLGEEADSHDPGEAGTAEALIDARGAYDVRENVLIRPSQGDDYDADPDARAAAEDLVAELRALPKPSRTSARPSPRKVTAGSRRMVRPPSSPSRSEDPMRLTRPIPTP